MKNKLKLSRKKIDQLDKKIFNLIKKRTRNFDLYFSTSDLTLFNAASDDLVFKKLYPTKNIVSDQKEFFELTLSKNICKSNYENKKT